MKRVLFIYYHYPPVMGGTGGIEFARLLPQYGWQPVVLSAAESVHYDKDYSMMDKVKGLEVYRVGHTEPAGEWQYLRNKMKLNYDFPDYYKTWLQPALQKARMILDKGDIDLIFSSSPPYTSAFIAEKLKREYKLPWVAEWRDLWSGNSFLNNSMDKTLRQPFRAILKSRILKAERRLISSADRTIVLHDFHRNQLLKSHGYPLNTPEVLTNGYSESDFQYVEPVTVYQDKPEIVFLGSVYPEYANLIDDFLKSLESVEPEAKTIFIGQGSIVVKSKSDNVVKILHMPRKQALGFALGADFLLLIMPPYAKWIPGKIFEYLRTGKPILALVPPDGDAARIITEASAGFILPYEPDAMKNELKFIFSMWGREVLIKAYNSAYVSQFEHSNLTRRLAGIFDEAVKCNPS